MSKRGRSDEGSLFGVALPKKTDAPRVAKTRSAHAGPTKAVVDRGTRRRLLQARLDALEASNAGDDAAVAKTGDEAHPLTDFLSLNSRSVGRGPIATAKKSGAAGARPGAAPRLTAAIPLLQIIAAETGELPPQLAASLGGGSGDAAAFLDVRGVVRDDARGADGQLLDPGRPAQDCLAAAVGPGSLPPRALCSVCGFSASAGGACTRCSARCCSAKCSVQHAQTRCFR